MIRKGLSDVDGIETRARTFVEQLALAFQASLLLRYSEPAVAETFCASRLGGDHGYAFGTLPRGVEFDKIIDRARPVIDS
jgi:putative acyl-CoA dehydrogenase